MWNFNDLMKSDLRKRLQTNINRWRKELGLPKSISTKAKTLTIKQLVGFHGQIKDAYMRRAI